MLVESSTVMLETRTQYHPVHVKEIETWTGKASASWGVCLDQMKPATTSTETGL